MTANQSVLTSKKPKEPSRKEDMNELRVAFNRVSIYDPMISPYDFRDRYIYNSVIR
jgi:hypothetical protein